MRQFTKPVQHNKSRFQRLKAILSKICDAKIKERMSIGSQNRQLIADEDFEVAMA